MLTLASIVEQQREAAIAGDASGFHRSDELFHAKLAEIAGYPGIWKLILQVKTQVDRFRQLTLVMPHRMFMIIEQHERILDAVQKADPEAAGEVMVAHLESVLPSSSELPHAQKKA